MLNFLIRIALHQRIVVILFTLGLIGGGIYAYSRLPVEAFPDVLNEYVQVITLAPGQSAEDVERKITLPLEREFSGIPKVIQERSISEFGLSVVYLYFDDNVDKYWARSQTMEKLSTVSLPPGVQPSLAAMSAVTGEILRYEVKGNGYTPTQLRSLQDWTLEREFRSVPGVADVVGYGGKVQTWEVSADPLRLATYGISLKQMTDAIQGGNANAGGNMIDWPTQSFVVRSEGEIRSVTDLENIGIAQKGNAIIRVKDVAQVGPSNAPMRGVVGRDNQDEIVQGIVLLRKGENPVLVGEALKKKLLDLNHGTILPEGVHLQTYYDRLELVAKTTKTVAKNLAEGLILVFAVLMIFLRNWRASLLVAFVVPLSLFFAFILMVASGTPANLISLGAIDFGIIVDGAVLIVEYVMMKVAELRDRGPAVIEKATGEVSRTVAFSMAMIILAYLPIFTLQRVEGKMFTPLAWTISFALLGALLVSLLFVPSLLGYVLGHDAHGGHHEDPRWFLRIRDRYSELLDRLAVRPKLFFGSIGAAVAAGLIAFLLSGAEFLPELDEGALWIRASFPHSTSLGEGVRLAREIRSVIRKNDEVRTVVSQLGGPEDGTDPNLLDNCEFFVDLKPKERWKRFGGEREKLVDSLRGQLREFVGVDFNISQPIADNVEEAVSGVKGKNAVKIFGPDLKTLNEIADSLIQVISSVKGTTDVGRVSVMPIVPQLTVKVDRLKVAQSGLALQDINDLVEIAVGGKVVTQVYDGESKLDVIVRASPKFRSSIADIENLPVSLPGGGKTRLGALASVAMLPAPQVITREDGKRRIGVKFNVEGRDLGSAMKEILEKAAAVKIPAGYSLVWGGDYENQTRAMKRLAVVLPATLLLLALVLFLLFGELQAVLAVMATLHLSMVGSVVLLTLRGIPFSVSAAVGLLALFGVITLNAVTLTGSLIEARDQGTSIREACLSRFRPILMTSLLAALGLLPAAISHGMGSETQRPLATAVIGGVISGMPAVLLFLPIFLNKLWKNRKILQERGMA